MSEMTIYSVAEQGNMMPYCTADNTTAEGANKLFKAMNNADEALKSFINLTIMITDVFVQRINRVDRETGEVKEATKIVLFDQDGTSYATISTGIYNALCNLCTVIGDPRKWKSPVTIKIVELTVASGNMLSFEVVDWGDNIPE